MALSFYFTGVAKVLKEAEELDKKTKFEMNLDELCRKICQHLEINIEELISCSRKPEVSKVRAIISYLAKSELGYSGAQIARVLKVSNRSANRCVEKGKGIVTNNPKIVECLS